jgi:hypothetical protein
MIGHVENISKLSRKDQLEAYDGCARLRPVWDELAEKYDAIITPSVPDIAPLGLGNTGDAVSCSPLSPPRFLIQYFSLTKSFLISLSAACGRSFMCLA